MKGHFMKQQKQSGFAHLAIIIVLIVALLGALGFVYWQNFMQLKIETPIPAIGDTPTSNLKTMSISEWGIKGTYTNTETLQYNMISNDNQLIFTSNDTRGKCATLFLVRHVGSERLNEGRVIGNSDNTSTVADYYNTITDGSIKHIGDYYFTINSSYAACGESATDPLEIANEKVIVNLREFFASLASI
jgi:nitrate reductase NapE component